MKKQIIEAGPNQVICQKWEESERGWGSRPDGFSLHLSIQGLARYVKKYWDNMPDVTPDEYSRPCGSPYFAGVSDSVKDQLEASGEGKRYYENYEYPGTGGLDGWIQVSQ